MAAEFWRFAEIGAALMKLHIEYEKQAEYPLEWTETGKLNWRVEKMALAKGNGGGQDAAQVQRVSDVGRDSGGGV
jgi:predicted helicase